MGWRSDRGYEEKQRREFARWKASAGWTDYLRWQWHRNRAFVAGAVAAGCVILAAASTEQQDGDGRWTRPVPRSRSRP